MFGSVSLLSQLTAGTKPQETVERIPDFSSAETPMLSPYQPSHSASTSELMSEKDNANDFKCHISAGQGVAHSSVLCLFSDWKMCLAQQFSVSTPELCFLPMTWWPLGHKWLIPSQLICYSVCYSICYKFATKVMVLLSRSAIRLQPAVWEWSAN